MASPMKKTSGWFKAICTRRAAMTRTPIPLVAPSVDREQGHSGYDGGFLQARWTRSSFG